MGKITKTMQARHRETLSPWLRDYVQTASSLPLPLIPRKLDEFPTRWPFPRGDLHHWIPLLNRFDNILEAFCATYKLQEGFQTRDFTCDLLLNKGAPVEYGHEEAWSKERLVQLGYKEDGDCQLIVSILDFTGVLLQHCGNRSIYASSHHLNDLLNTTSQNVVFATLQVGLELAQRYQASIKRVTQPSRQVSSALLANHYNFDLDRVQFLSQPFVKTPVAPMPRFSDLPPVTPASATKGKDKAPSASHKNVASMYANDLTSLIAPGPTDDGRWAGWGDIKVVYYPQTDTATQEPQTGDRGASSAPTTPTPLRRSSTSVSQTPRSNRFSGVEDSPSNRNQGASGDDNVVSGPKSIEIRQATVQSTSIYDLLKLCPADMPKASRYEFLNRLRICKALLGSPQDRQLALAIRLLAITNLAYIHPETTFAEKVLKQDNDEPRRYQLVYQLAELIHPSVDGAPDTPLRLQAIALAALEAISVVPTKYADVLSALNANVNHGVLLYVIRKAVASMKEDPVESDEGKVTDADHWRTALFALTLHMAMSSRIGQEMASAGLLEVLVEILNLRSKVATRNYSMVLGFLDTIVYNYQGAFTVFSSASGLDAISNLIVDTVAVSKELAAAGQGTKPEFHAQLVDYEIPFYHQQTLKWLLKFIHHIMSNAFTFGANTDRLLRNLVDNSALLGSLRVITEEMRVFGSVVWTNAATLLGDFINNDPTSFAAISESGMIKSFLETLTGKAVTQPKPPGTPKPETHEGEDVGSPDYSEDSVTFESDERPHPPTQEMLEAPRERLAHGILASADAINIIPSVLNSISLNNAGMGMIVASNALDSFLEIFESPDHVQVMLATDHDLPNNVGSSFDELARHHPALRPTISNAVIDMVARVLHIAKTKSADAGWGAKLQILDPNGKPVTADDTLIARAEAPVTSSKGKDKATADDADVEMADAGPVTAQPPTTDKDSDVEDQKAAGPFNAISPYIWAASSFLNTLFSNSSLKATFIRDGGIELLLELSEAPSLPEDFDNTPASRVLSQVLAQLIEASPVLGIPSLLNRIHAAVDDLQPLVGREGVHPFFAPFIVPDLSLINDNGQWDQSVVRKVAGGTRAVKALVKLQALIKTLYQSFPYSTRHAVATMPAVNVFDYFSALIKRLGPLLRDIITEEMAIAALVPQHWTGSRQPLHDGTELPTPPGFTAGDGDTPDDEGVISSSRNKASESTAQAKKPTLEERSSIRFQNYNVIHRLLHSLTPSALPFFQTIGKTLLPRRGTDLFLRSHHMSIAEALADTVLEQLKMSQEKLTAKNLHYWIMMFHMLREMLIDPTRSTERAVVQLILPVLVAFKERGGMEVLNAMLQKFSDEVCNGATEGEEAHKVRLATVGMKKILDIYHLIVNGKNVTDSLTPTNLVTRSADRNRDFGHQLVVELRLAILPTARRLWESELAEKAPTPVLSRLIDILKTISAADQESNAWRKSDKTSPPSVFKNRESVRFNWALHSDQVTNLTHLDYDEELAREAVYRVNGKLDDAAEYCRAHSKGLAGKRNPIPEEDAYQSPPSPKPQQTQDQSPTVSAADALGSSAGPMALDSMPEINNLIRDAMGEAVLGDLGENSSDESNDASHMSSSQHSASQEAGGGSSALAPPGATSSSSPGEPPAAPSTAKEDLDKERAELQNDLIDRCLDVVRAHPDSVFEVSDLIHGTILKSDNEDKRTEVGEVLANALMSFAMNDEDERKSNGRGIAAYAHLLSLLLQNRPFFKSTLPTLKQNIGDYLGFLKVSPASSNEELPPWMPYILLIFEILLSDDEQPVEVQWKAPTKDDDPVEQPVWVTKEPAMSGEDRTELLAAILDVLPRVGKEESLAVCVLRILVILTRDHTIAKTVGEKRNLQRLFVMAKQSCSGGSTRLNQSHISDNIMIILRHIVEDEDIIRQMMQTEIQQCLTLSQRNTRSFDVYNYLRHLSHVSLRAPKLFVDVTTELVKLNRFSSSSIDGGPRAHNLSLKEKAAEQVTPPKDGSVEPAVQATEDLTIEDVKPSTEAVDKEMTDAPKTPFELKRPVLEHPDGVVHFLLCELLNYREVDDKEPSSHASKELKAEDATSSANGEATPPPADQPVSEQKDKDKKSSKPTFKADDHPIFVYRCFLLNCLAELLQNYNRCKVEFINFKRSAPMQTNTPIKPRSSILNYLLNDLLCLVPTGLPMDSTVIKKKAATSHHAQAVLVALVARTPEKPIDRSRDQFEYDDDPDLLFVRRFVLDTVLRAYKEASLSSEPFEARYAKMMCTAELMSLMIGERGDKDGQPKDGRGTDPAILRSQMQLKRLMYEKGYLAALTASIADIDLTFPNVKRTIKYTLRVLRALTKTACQLSQSDVIPATTTDQPEEDFASASSLSDLDDDREETPDLYRNSTLGMLEPREEDYTDESEDDDDAMYDDEPYDDELDYGDEMSQDEEENPSDDDEEELDEMGEIEGLPGEPGVVEVIMGENDDEDEDMDEDDEDEPSDEEEDEDEMDSDDMEEVEDQIEIVDEEGNAIDDDGASGWESETDEDEEDQEELDYEAEVEDIVRGINDGGMRPARMPDILRAVVDGDDLDGEDIPDFEEHYIDDVAEEDDEEEEDEGDEDEVYYDQGHLHDDHQPPAMPSGLGWDIAIEPGNRFRPGGTRSPFPAAPFMMGGHREPGWPDFRSYMRSGHARPPPNATDDGVNPLLLSNNRPGQDPSPRASSQHLIRLGFSNALMGPGIDAPLAFINDLMQTLPLAARGGPALSLQLRSEGPAGEIRHVNIPLGMTAPGRETRWEPRRETYQEPHQAVAFTAESTSERWQEEAKMIFTFNHNDKSRLLAPAILGMLTPPAIQLEKEAKARADEEKRVREEERKRREEEERKEREAKEAEERAAREKKEAEERERQERERAEAEAARAAEEASAAAEPAAEESQAMEGVESHGEPENEQQQPSVPAQRVVTVIRGETVDVTELGIDPEYLEALPEEFREEVIAQTISTRRSQAREQATNEGENTEVFQEFLEALPDELRMEIVQQERQERRRRERDEQRRQAAAAGQDLGPSDMDPASILLTFPPALREQVLMDQGEDIMEHLPPELAAEARALAQRHNLHRAPPAVSRTRDATHRPEVSGVADTKAQRRTIVQMLDKAGVATLLRLMFVTQQGSLRNSLFDVFTHVCENRQNRLEVVSTLLQILQDGSTDMDAVERSFSQLSLKAKQPKDKDPKTPQSLKRTFTNISTADRTTSNSDVSPLLVVQQCLDLLQELATKNPHITSLFLTEHEAVASTLKRSSSRKGKGKDLNTKAQKYAINSLLALLDRSLVMESSAVMQLLADLLNKVTYPLQALERRRKEAEEEAKKAAEKAKEEKAEPNTETANPESAEASEEQPPAPQTSETVASTAEEHPTTQDSAKPEAESSTTKESKPEEKKVRQLTPPTIPDHNLKLVINIFVARECSSKTFQNTISTIKNLSNIPGAKKIFGEELVSQARALSENIVSDLDDLLPHILRAETGTEIQGIALAKFSPGASEQNKLLRVLTALDHLFDNKGKKSGGSTGDSEGKEETKEDLLGSLYWNPTFATMWDKLSACLSAIRQRESMLNVATILLPLIESLMVVCKNTALSDAPGAQRAAGKDMLLSSPPPENRIAGLFFTFTEEHRRILNELVRQNPKLMSGTFSLLVKNPKVLEFDNKRNYFNRSVHSKTGHQQSRPQYQPLQLSVRREHVFHDSFKSLYFKSGPEMKFGRLNIRFHGEEGVDAGGVTREWFQVLARQMFDPNYALFIPVSSDRTTFHPNKLSGINDEHLMFFKFIGRIIGKALYEGRLLDCYFSRAVYKRILGKPVSVKDMESFDPDYYKSLVWMLENDITDIIVETFSVEDDEFGVTKVVDLIENGRNIPVTEENKHEYVRLIVEHKLLTSVKEQMENFLKGFHDIIPEDLIAIFNEQELELLISGLPDIDVDDWKSNTEYHNYTAASQQIQWFWRAVRSFDKEERAKLLQFVTGTSKVPLNGFKELEGMNGVSRFNIHRDYGNKERLPSSHTCFNQLDLPEYESYDTLRSQLLKAITAGSDYFGFA
ncbi:E3 ubiquitin-protein ligase tom1 [Madurella fahalii]|uniref:HECT-type E3 ubiquitin transferase n=1 Tax=Madurella fahalii TaxID=1157608 RepID=A0ABQ0G5Y3_9PEZI